MTNNSIVAVKGLETHLKEMKANLEKIFATIQYFTSDSHEQSRMMEEIQASFEQRVKIASKLNEHA